MDGQLRGTPAPILHVSGWYDDVMIGTMENWANLRPRGLDWLVMGPWPHSVNTATHLGQIDFGPQSVIDLEALHLRW